MITVVSIALYLAAVFFSVITGVIAEQVKNGSPSKSGGCFAVAFVVLAFLMAVVLQVFS